MKRRGLAVGVFATCCCTLASSSSALAAVVFAPEARTQLVGGEQPAGIVAADLNGDGRLDVATANSATDSVSPIFGNGAGGFAPSLPIGVGDAPRSIAAGDLNADGRPDLVTANADSDNVSALLGPGFGLWKTCAVGDNPFGVAVGNLDALAGADVVTANRVSDDVTVRVAAATNCNIHIQPQLPVGDSPRAVAVGDVNGDGRPDLAVANFGDGTVSILLWKDAAAQFHPATSVVMGDSPRDVELADLNGDGKLDLAAANRLTDQVTVRLGDGTGGFSAASSHTAGNSPRALAAADLSGDGQPDLAVANGDSEDVSVLVGNGSGGFSSGGSFDVGLEPESLVAGDFNGDGSQDVVTANFLSNDISLLRSAPAVGLAPASLAFADTEVGQQSPQQTVTVTNTGSAPLHVSSVTLGGTNPDFFSIGSQSCTGAAIAPGGTCTASVRFVPTAAGTASAALRVASDAGGSPHSVALSGRGIQPRVGLTPEGFTFATTRVGQQTAAKTATITNTGTAPLDITSVTLGGANPESFGITSQNCAGASIAPGASCTASVRFAPTAPGPRTARLEITSDAPGSPHAVALSGEGIQPQATVSPTSLAFPSTQVGQQSAAQTVTVKNTGTAALNVSSLALVGTNPGSFRIVSQNCTGAPVSPGATCTANVAFRPEAAGARSATLLITSDAPGSPHAVSLSGNGTAPPPRCLIFGLFCRPAR